MFHEPLLRFSEGMSEPLLRKYGPIVRYGKKAEPETVRICRDLTFFHACGKPLSGIIKPDLRRRPAIRGAPCHGVSFKVTDHQRHAGEKKGRSGPPNVTSAFRGVELFVPVFYGGQADALHGPGCRLSEYSTGDEHDARRSGTLDRTTPYAGG